MDDVIKNGSIPILISLGSAPEESFVCKVLNTKWPVKAAWVAKEAVSASRISPTIIILGSCLRTLLRPSAKENPIFGFTWHWLIPGISYSTGSSRVITFTCGLLIFCKIEYKVVDLPEPVGPVAKITP